MRSTKLSSAIAAAAALLAFAPAGALAVHAHQGVKPHPGLGRCHVSLSADPHIVTTNESVLVSGALRCPSGEVSGQTVTIYERIAGVPGFKVIGTPTTVAGGLYTFTPPALITDSTFYATALGARSGNKTVRVAPQVSTPVVTMQSGSTSSPQLPEGSQLFTGFAHRATFRGSVSPTDQGAEVLLERESGTSTEEWGAIQGHVFVKADGSFTIVHNFGVPGDANLRVLVRPHGKFNQRGLSDAVNYLISQTQNANLTLEPSTNPIGYGQLLVVKGVLKAGAGQKVVLMGHTFGTTFAKVGEAITGAGGTWEVKIAGAVQNTHYQAVSGAVHSAVVFEGVKWNVTANPIPAKVSSGTLVTFTGTASPEAREGHTVYLERKNLSGGGYRIVDLGVVGKGGALSIPFDVIGSGKQVYRIKLPGDPINEGNSSSPLETEVTPAVVLTPQTQPTLPH